MNAAPNPMHELIGSVLWLPKELLDIPAFALLSLLGIDRSWAALVEWTAVGLAVTAIYRMLRIGPLRGENGTWYWLYITLLWPGIVLYFFLRFVWHTMTKRPAHAAARQPETAPAPLTPDQIRQAGGA